MTKYYMIIWSPSVYIVTQFILTHLGNSWPYFELLSVCNMILPHLAIFLGSFSNIQDIVTVSLPYLTLFGHILIYPLVWLMAMYDICGHIIFTIFTINHNGQYLVRFGRISIAIFVTICTF